MKEAHRKAPDPDDAISFDHLHGRTDSGSAPTGPQGPIAFTAIALPTHGLWLRGSNRLARKFELLAPPGRMGSGRAELFHTVPAPLGAVKKLSDQTVPARPDRQFELKARGQFTRSRKRFRAARSSPPQLCYGQGDRTVAHAQRLGLRGGRTVTSAVQLKIKSGCHQVCSTPSPHAKRTYLEPQPSGRSALLHVYRLILTVGSHRHAFVEVIPKAAKSIKSNIKYKTGPPCTGDQRAKIALAMTTLENPREKLGHP